jgi:hypothetical protein
VKVFARPVVSSRPPRLEVDEPEAAIFTGTPLQVAAFLAAHGRMASDAAALAVELTHLERTGTPTDCLCFMVEHGRKVTVRA